MNSGTAVPQTPVETVSFKNELLRKGIHLSSLSIPILYYYLDKQTALYLLLPVTVSFVIVDLLRSVHKPTFELYKRVFGSILRHHEQTVEKKTLNGASWVLISATLCVLIFPKVIAITAFTILIISDTVSALIGRKYGTKMFRGKTLEGSTAFVLSAAICILFTPKVGNAVGEYLIAFVAAIFGALAEVFSFDILDDNFAIPFTIGFTLWIFYAWLFPELNVYVLDF